MKTVLVLCFLLCAAYAAPAEVSEGTPEPVLEVVNEEPAAESEKETRTVAQVEEEDSPKALTDYCPVGWFSYSLRCYKYVNSPMTWFKAKEHCNDLGGTLASVPNPKVYSFLQQLAVTAGQSPLWLGGFNLQGQWMWTDREGFYYTNWQSQSSVSSYPCLYLQSTNGWRNNRCTLSYRFICSRNAFSC